MPIKPPSPPYVGPAAHTSSGSNKPIKRVVIHSTVSPCREGQARATAAYFRSPSAGGSAHYVCDPGDVVQVVFDSVIAWHSPPNSNSLGIELCDMPGQSESQKAPISRWRDREHAAMLKRAARLVAGLCLAYDVPIRKVGPVGLKLGRKGICGHIDVTRAFGQSSHWDPGNFPWKQFIVMVRREASRIKGGGSPTPPVAPEPATPPKPEPSHRGQARQERIRQTRTDLRTARTTLRAARARVKALVAKLARLGR